MLFGEPPKKSKVSGSPPWMTTFADLMSLLMCFFVLLLSFSEMDVMKFKQVAGSMAMAFGVQREVFTRTTPMGTSFVAREFSPGRPDPTSLKTVRQQTTYVRPQLDISRRSRQHIESIASRVSVGLKEEIRKGLVDVETEGYKIIIRIQEKGSFPSGSAELMRPFKPVIAKIGALLVDTPGRIVIAGHTDNVPIATGRFRSNWELSSSRAVTVMHELLKSNPIPQQRFLIEGHGEMKPLAPNDRSENRARNRRVEIVLEQEPGRTVSGKRDIVNTNAGG